MATGLVIHITSGDDRHTEILTGDRVLIGTSDACDLRLRSSTVPKTLANTVLLELNRSDGVYRVTNFAPAVPFILNGEPLEPGTEIQDGDELRVTDANLLLHFYPVRALPAVVPV